MNEGLVVMVRGIIGFFTLLIFARVLGKQQISQLNYFDYALGITIGSIAGSLTTDLSSRAWPHWVGLLTWTVLGMAVEYITIKCRSCGKIIDGEPIVIIMDGKILEKALKKARYRVSDIMALLRNKDVFHIQEVEFAIIEPNGQLSVLKKAEVMPATKKDLKLPIQKDSIEVTLIYDGIIIDKNLKQLNLTMETFMKELAKEGIKDPKEVFLATKNPKGKLYIDKYEDYISRVIKL